MRIHRSYIDLKYLDVRNFLLLIIIFSFFQGCSCSYSRKKVINQDLWFFVFENDTIFFDFGNEIFNVDTIDFVEGIAYYHRSQSDSSYFRINSNTPWASFEGGSIDKNNVISTINKGNVVDSRGMTAMGNLYWRSLTFLEFEVVYSYCPEDKLKQYDKVLDSVYEQYTRVKKNR